MRERKSDYVAGVDLLRSAKTFPITENQKRLMAKYTRLSKYDDGWLPCLQVGHQRFGLGIDLPRKDAAWHCWQLAKALESLLAREAGK